MVQSNPCVGRSPRNKISFFVLPICTDELWSIPKIIAFLPQSNFGSKQVNVNQVQSLTQNKNIYLGQHFLADPKSFTAKSALKIREHVSNSI